MQCRTAEALIQRLADRELCGPEQVDLEAHMLVCLSCARSYRLLTAARRIGLALPAVQPSPYFVARLRAKLDSEAQGLNIWNIIVGLSRRVIPALALITVLLCSVFAYYQIQSAGSDVYQAYDRIFTSGDRPHRMVIADQGEITDESVLTAIAEEDPAHAAGDQNNRDRQ